MSKENAKTAKKKWVLPAGHIQFIVILPPPLAQQFIEEMKLQDRKKLPLARLIIAKYFKDKPTKGDITGAIPLPDELEMDAEAPLQKTPAPRRGAAL